ncbi:hypothetical protein K474DRAFT_1704269 [Panus rudis PR-1116 ss-1]|nr:hypothetical protein K474DRAFT_1704269 [Panus rudis PR-1116 ss-1]
MPNPTGVNGRKPSPPDEILRPLVESFVALGYNNPEIEDQLRRGNYYDTRYYNVSADLLRKKRSQKHWCILGARGQKHTLQTLAEPIEGILLKYPMCGSHKMKEHLLRHEGVATSRKLILAYMNVFHRELVLARRTRRLIRKVFWAVGVNDIWCFDQHDKWRRFELYLHIGLEPFSGRILWLKIWWTNRNPRRVCSYYLDTVENLGGVIPVLTQSDHGTENNGIANAQTVLRHRLDPSLRHSLQHKFKGAKRNIKPEIAWRLLRQNWVPGFEEVLEFGTHFGLYDPEDILQRLVFHYVFIPWLQSELDIYVQDFNYTKGRRNRKKATPHGRPMDIYLDPPKYNSLDFSIKVPQEYIDDVRQQFAPPDHHCFELVPPAFAAKAEDFYSSLIGPRQPRNRDFVWSIYAELLAFFQSIEVEVGDPLQTEIAEWGAMPAVGEDPEEVMPVLKGLQRVPGVGRPYCDDEGSDDEEEIDVEPDYNEFSDGSEDEEIDDDGLEEGSESD